MFEVKTLLLTLWQILNAHYSPLSIKECVYPYLCRCEFWFLVQLRII